MKLTEEQLNLIISINNGIDFNDDVETFNRYLNVALRLGYDHLKNAFRCNPYPEGLPNLKDKNLYFINGTSAYVIDHFKTGNRNFIQVAASNEGDLIEYDWQGYTKQHGYTILEITEQPVEIPLITLDIEDNHEQN